MPKHETQPSPNSWYRLLHSFLSNARQWTTDIVQTDRYALKPRLNVVRDIVDQCLSDQKDATLRLENDSSTSITHLNILHLYRQILSTGRTESV